MCAGLVLIIDHYKVDGSYLGMAFVIAEGRIYMDEMQSSAMQDGHLKPRAHVFLSLMRGFDERGDLECAESLRLRMVTEAGGQKIVLKQMG